MNRYNGHSNERKGRGSADVRGTPRGMTIDELKALTAMRIASQEGHILAPVPPDMDMKTFIARHQQRQQNRGSRGRRGSGRNRQDNSNGGQHHQHQQGPPRKSHHEQQQQQQQQNQNQSAHPHMNGNTGNLYSYEAEKSHSIISSSSSSSSSYSAPSLAGSYSDINMPSASSYGNESRDGISSPTIYSGSLSNSSDCDVGRLTDREDSLDGRSLGSSCSDLADFCSQQQRQLRILGDCDRSTFAWVDTSVGDMDPNDRGRLLQQQQLRQNTTTEMTELSTHTRNIHHQIGYACHIGHQQQLQQASFVGTAPSTDFLTGVAKAANAGVAASLCAASTSTGGDGVFAPDRQYYPGGDSLSVPTHLLSDNNSIDDDADNNNNNVNDDNNNNNNNNNEDIDLTATPMHIISSASTSAIVSEYTSLASSPYDITGDTGCLDISTDAFIDSLYTNSFLSEGQF